MMHVRWQGRDGGRMRRGLTVVALCGLSALQSGCEERVPSRDPPVSYWLNDSDECVRLTAKSIIASGRPWPNEISTEVDGRPVLKEFDAWFGEQLYVLPGRPRFLTGVGSARSYPLKYSNIQGNAEEVLGIPPLRFKDSKVGGTLYGNVNCFIGRPQSLWVENRVPPVPDVAHIRLLMRQPPKNHQWTETRRREDLGMVEVTAGNRDELYAATGSNVLTAAYLPFRDSLTQRINGVTYSKSIWCNERHDPDAPLRPGAFCGTWLWLGPGISIDVSVYQQYLPLLPALHDQVLRVLEQSRSK